MHSFLAHLYSTFWINSLNIGHCAFSNILDSKSWNHSSVVKPSLENVRWSLIGKLRLLAFQSKEFFEIFWWLALTSEGWLDDLWKVHAVLVGKELTVVHDIIEAVMHLLKSCTFSGFEVLKTSHRIYHGMIPRFTYNTCQISFHLNNSKPTVSKSTKEKISLISLLILKNHESVQIELIIHIEHLHVIICCILLCFNFMDFHEFYFVFVVWVNHSSDNEFNFLVIIKSWDINLMIILGKPLLNLLLQMWVIAIMQIDIPMIVTNILIQTSTDNCLVSFTSTDWTNREWII